MQVEEEVDPMLIDLYLELSDYESVEEWALDSDYHQVNDDWYDENGHRVDIRIQLFWAIEAMLYWNK